MNFNNQSFSGGVFHPSIPGGRAGAQISINRGEIIAYTLGDGQPTFSIPINQCQLELGGASGRMLFCRTHDGQLTIFSEDKQFAKALELHSGGLLGDQISTMKKALRAESSRLGFWIVAGSIACALLLFIGYFAMIWAAKATIASLPISIDEKIGKLAMDSMEVGKRLDPAHPASKLVQSIVDKLQPHAAIPQMKFKVLVVEAPQVNAFALPGGQIVVFTGLIREAKSAEQIAGVLAHEMSHATLRHGLQSVGQSLGIVAAIQLFVGDIGGLVALGAQIAQQSILTSYSRTSETEADLEGARMLHAAKIDPQSMADFFGLLKEKEGDIPDAIAWISTHPQHTTRIENIRNHQKSFPATQYEPLELNLKEAQDAL
jgi:Zn-dependent protease with chaperone function